MPIDPKEIDSIEKSMVHDEDQNPAPEGWGVYLTLRYISKVVLGAYGVMLLGMQTLQLVLRGDQKMPVSLRPESVLLAIPFTLVAIYLYLTSDAEPEIAKKRTVFGRLVTFVSVFVVMQVASVVLWVLIAKSFSMN